MLVKRLFFVVFLSLFTVTSFASEIKNIRVWAAPDNTRIVLDLSSNAKYNMFTLDNPSRVVVDVERAKFLAQIDEITIIDTGIKRIRYGEHKKRTRLVFDLEQPSTVNSFMLEPNESYGHRLVIDLSFKKKTVKALPQVSIPQHNKKFIVAIDPGHGGEDPGATGKRYNTKEKDVVLAVAKKLKKYIDNTPDMHSYLVRSGDYYIGLRNRMAEARDKNADIFISLHADSFKDPRANGASVYVLSDRGASSEAARWLAESENKADLIGGVTLEDKGDILASVLLDLSQTATSNASFDLAESLIDDLKLTTQMHKKTVQRAGFMVLKSPDVPSVLVELGFISNKHGEQKLRQSRYQDQIAKSLFKGVRNYAKNKPRPVWQPSNIAKLQHRVAPGDTLFEIAQRYNVSVTDLKSSNNVIEKDIQIGDTIYIPSS
jgi:N-acetylmuramoyl-L-alanine amidase